MTMDDDILLRNAKGANYPNLFVYPMDDLDDVAFNLDMDVRAVILAVQDGNFNIDDAWFWFDGYGNLMSFTFDFENYSCINVSEIIDYIERTSDDLDNCEIAEILEGVETC